MRRILLLWLAWLVALPAAAAVTVLDDAGTEHRFDAPPLRIVSMLPSLTESVCALGACARLVGVDRYSNWPDAVQSLPKLGGLEDAHVERIVALKPDLVLAADSARVVARLRSLGLRVMLFRSDTHAEVKRSLERIALLLGTPGAAERVWTAIERDIAEAASRVPAALRGQRVYFEVASAPYAAGAASFVGQSLARLGMGNIVPPEMGPFPKLNPEFVVRARPDIVMAEAAELAAMRARPGWQGLPALEGRSCGLAPARYELVTRPGPRMGEAAHVLADCLAGLEQGRR